MLPRVGRARVEECWKSILPAFLVIFFLFYAFVSLSLFVFISPSRERFVTIIRESLRDFRFNSARHETWNDERKKTYYDKMPTKRKPGRRNHKKEQGGRFSGFIKREGNSGGFLVVLTTYLHQMWIVLRKIRVSCSRVLWQYEKFTIQDRGDTCRWIGVSSEEKLFFFSFSFFATPKSHPQKIATWSKTSVISVKRRQGKLQRDRERERVTRNHSWVS